MWFRNSIFFIQYWNECWHKQLDAPKLKKRGRRNAQIVMWHHFNNLFWEFTGFQYITQCVVSDFYSSFLLIEDLQEICPNFRISEFFLCCHIDPRLSKLVRRGAIYWHGACSMPCFKRSLWGIPHVCAERLDSSARIFLILCVLIRS